MIDRLLDAATKDERDMIIELISDLPSRFFGNYGDWVASVKALNNLVRKLEERRDEALERSTKE